MQPAQGTASNNDYDVDGFPVMLRLHQVCEKIQVTRQGLNNIERRTDFPRPVKFGRELYYYRSEVLNWMGLQRVTRVGGKPASKEAVR
jgi:predicted DNA-binding transcriptional regulator AlpA